MAKCGIFVKVPHSSIILNMVNGNTRHSPFNKIMVLCNVHVISYFYSQCLHRRKNFMENGNLTPLMYLEISLLEGKLVLHKGLFPI